jgi:hypothetical protein
VAVHDEQKVFVPGGPALEEHGLGEGADGASDVGPHLGRRTTKGVNMTLAEDEAERGVERAGPEPKMGSRTGVLCLGKNAGALAPVFFRLCHPSVT